MPKVSVIIPCFNHKAYLGKRMASVLGQTYQDFEVILLDDCSTDGSADVLRSYRQNPQVSHVVVNSRNTGRPFQQWERGIRLAKGEYIWIAESDDYAEPDFLATTVPLLDAHPGARLCLTGSYVVDGNDAPIPPEKYGFDPWEADGRAYVFDSSSYLASHMLAVNSVYNASMVLFRREGCLDGIGPRFCQMRYCGDWLFWVEQIRKGSEVVEVHRKLNYFRKHDANTTNKGSDNGNSLGEIAFIRRLLYRSGAVPRRQVWRDRVLFYRIVRGFPVASAQRKKELLGIIAREGGFTRFRYVLAKLCLAFWRRG